MKAEFTVRNGNSRLLLFFAGWSTDASAFGAVRCEGFDIAVLSDYSDLTLPPLPGYEEVVVIAWSLGVWAAARVLPQSGLPVTLAMAVNGTTEPVSDTHGIPAAIFRGTAANLSEASLRKFRRRMGAADMPRGSRTIESLAAELEAIDRLGPSEHGFRWDRALVSEGDLIFPPAAQKAAWQAAGVATDVLAGAHTPASWQSVVDAYVIDKPLVAKRFSRGMTTYPDESSVQQRIASHLLELWQKHGRKPAGRVLEAGYGDGGFTRLYSAAMKPSELLLWDISATPFPGAETRECDAETAIMGVGEGEFDVIVSANTIQWFNSPLRFIERALRALCPGGLLVLSTFGPETFRELTESGVVPLPYLSASDYRAAVPAGAELLECHDGVITKVFPAPIDVFRHLRATGVNARTSTRPLPEILARYPLRPDGRASLTYNPIYLLIRKKQ